ncbi:fungal pheromone STE3G-protein-coupled receptor [Artomyces pyxidatus]|uniref:Fungal pheromone STE3G-protein-coupled receptor n=1 Tax=Artomyces pyxidatus TaxID=48021 RepID=A0ACB8SU27_9AGAM|nr:fungal pheromone STE3G-protein-coupled receptor [Artomyces pyxidatus]
MSEPPNAVFSAFSFTGVILVLTPFYWHAEAGNTGTCLFMFWVALGCLVTCINSIVWNGTVLNKAPVWCDIATHIIVANNVAVTASTLCITRRLQLITSDAVTKVNKRREAYIDLAIGLGLPLFNVGISFFVQGHRFDILEDVGCWPVTVNTTASYFVIWAWPIVLGAISAGFGISALYNFIHRRRELSSMISSGTTQDSFTLQKSLYIRLMTLASIDVLFTVPLASYLLYLDRTASSFTASADWEWIHYDFSRVGQIPSVEWKATAQSTATIELSRWANVLSAFVFFALFGVAQEAQKNYRVFWAFLRRVGHAATGARFEKCAPSLSYQSCAARG